MENYWGIQSSALLRKLYHSWSIWDIIWTSWDMVRPKIAISYDNNYIVTGSGNTIKIWNVKTGSLLKALKTSWWEGSVESITISPDNSFIVTGSRFTTKIWKLKLVDFDPIDIFTKLVISKSL